MNRPLPPGANALTIQCPVCATRHAWVWFPGDPGSPIHGPTSCHGCGKTFTRSFILEQFESTEEDGE